MSFPSYFKEAIGTFKTSGSVRPSSKYLINACLKDIDFGRAKTLVEFGPGNGCFTKEIAQRMGPEARLISFEINPNFYAYCHQNYNNGTQVKVVNESAFDFDTILSEANIGTVDYFVSSLPLALFSADEVSGLLEKVQRFKVANGAFIQYQYSLRNYSQLKRHFDHVQVAFTLRNIPPAFIYKCL